MATKAAGLSTSNPRRPAAINLTDLGALIERADDIVALIARNRAARAGLGKTGRAVLRDHERQLEAELAGIRELASHRCAVGTNEALFQIILAIADLQVARAMANRHGERDLADVIDCIERLLDGARDEIDQLGETGPLYRIGQHLAPVTQGPHCRAAEAMERIAAVEASNV